MFHESASVELSLLTHQSHVSKLNINGPPVVQLTWLSVIFTTTAQIRERTDFYESSDLLEFSTYGRILVLRVILHSNERIQKIIKKK